MSRIQDQQFDEMMENEYMNFCQQQLKEDEEYERWLIEQEKESERIRETA